MVSGWGWAGSDRRGPGQWSVMMLWRSNATFFGTRMIRIQSEEGFLKAVGEQIERG